MKLLFDKNNSAVPDSIDTISRIDLEKKLNFPKQTGNPNNADYILYGLEGNIGTDELFLIRFGELLNILQMLIPKNVDNPSNPTPLITIMDVDDLSKPENWVLMYNEPFQISGDPRKCLVGGFKYGTYEFFPQLGNNSYVQDIDGKGHTVGALKNI